LRFAAFLASLVGIYKITVKVLQRTCDIDDSYCAAIAGGLASLSMLLDPNPKLALYLATKTLETVYMEGMHNGQLPCVKNFDAILYSICTALILHGAFVQPHILNERYYHFVCGLTGQRINNLNRQRMNVFGTESTKYLTMKAN